MSIYGRSPRETGGPIVQTGPTAGENRSRNNDGQWRAKRSDAGTTRSNNDDDNRYDNNNNDNDQNSDRW